MAIAELTAEQHWFRELAVACHGIDVLQKSHAEQAEIGEALYRQHGAPSGLRPKPNLRKPLPRLEIDPIDVALLNSPAWPEDRFTGDGIVTCGGGAYAPSAWVLCNLLRHVGCTLPIECWVTGWEEVEFQWVLAMARLDVRIVVASELGYVGLPVCGVKFRGTGDYKPGSTHGYALKSFAVLHSRFEGVLFIDADNCPARDPASLLDTEAFQRTGAVFWPDISPTMLTPDWPAFGVKPGKPCESGQFLIDKRRCWPAVNLANWLNANGHHYYRFAWGDKDTFPAAWRRCGLPYKVVGKSPVAGDTALIQHDLEGEPLFWHRCGPFKWRVDGEPNEAMRDYPHWQQCLQAIEHYPRRRKLNTWKDRADLELAIKPETAQLGQNLTVSRVLNGPALLVDDRETHITPHLEREGYWESWITLFLSRVIRRGMTVVDVGANCGCFTALAAEHVGDSGRVLAIEPQPSVATMLGRSIVGNGWKHVELAAVAAGRERGQAVLYASRENTLNASQFQRLGPEQAKTITVPMDTLDNLAAGRKVDIVKIDAEGAEEAIWGGMQGVVAAGASVLLEYRGDRYSDATAFLGKIRAAYPTIQAVGFDGEAQPVSDADILAVHDQDWMLWLTTLTTPPA